MGKKVLDVGQCGFDGPRLRRMLREKVGAEVECADTLEEAREKLQSAAFDLVLVNRVLAKNRARGIEVVAMILSECSGTKVMLVSDKPEAQDEAVKLGAVRGFGKANLFTQETEQLVCGELGGC
jgi:DNA-binding response OmpR family regulator